MAVVFLILPAAVQAQTPEAITEAATEIGLTVATVHGAVNANDARTAGMTGVSGNAYGP